MKKIFYGFFCLIILFSCTGRTGYEIKGNIEGLDSKNIKLVEIKGRDVVPISEVKVDNGTFKFKGNIDDVKFVAIDNDNNNHLCYFYLENGIIEIKGNIKDSKGIIVTGSSINQLYNAFEEKDREYESIKDNLEIKYNEALKARDTIDAMNVLEKYYSVNEEKAEFLKSFVDENSNSVIIANVIYFNQHMFGDDIIPIVENLGPDAKKGYYYDEIHDFVERMKRVQIGNQYVDFEMQTVDNKMVKLSDFVGNDYLLVDFWASWCGPCRRENPNFVKIYKEFHPKGFDILGVSLDSEKESWVKAIEHDSLEWTHISDLKFWQNEGARLYTVQSIPSNVLLDKEGKIIAKDLMGEELEMFLDSLYNVK